MKQLLGILLVSLLVGSWLSFEEAHCQDLHKGIRTVSYCYHTSSGKTCFKTFLIKNSRPVRESFNNASRWCNLTVPGSSLIIIDSVESERTVESFIGRQPLATEAVVIDAQKLSASESLEWSWVNGNLTVLTDARYKAEQFHDGACVESKHGKLSYCFGNVSSQYRYICEYSDTKAVFSYRQNNKSYVAKEVPATWFDARKECLSLGGDLASITELQMVDNWLARTENQTQRYWIGLHRNKWIWKSSGAAITYTNWEGGYPDDTSDKQCICISPLCRRENERTIREALNDRKWWSCNCNHSYAIVCQGGITGDTASTSSMSEEPPNNCAFDDQTTAFTSPSSPSSPTAGQLNSFNTKQIFLILLLFVAVVFIIVAVILIIRKRKYRNEGSPMKNSKQSEKVSSAYTAGVSDNNRPSESTVPPGTTIYAVVEMTKQPAPPSSNTIYAIVQPTSEAVDMGKSVEYADLDFQMKDLQKRNSAGKIAACLSPIYSQPFEPTTTSSNSEYAEPLKPEPDKTMTTTTPALNHHQAAVDQQIIYSLAEAIPLGDPNVIYSEPNKPTKSSTPTGKAVESADPIYLEAIEVKHVA